MKTSLLLASVLLAGTVGVGFAATEVLDHHHRSEGHRPAVATADDADRGAVRVADSKHEREARGRHHDDDEDDDDDEDEGRGDHDGRGGARMPATGPTDPTAPVPDNGLFQGKARPKVEVQ